MVQQIVVHRVPNGVGPPKNAPAVRVDFPSFKTRGFQVPLTEPRRFPQRRGQIHGIEASTVLSARCLACLMSQQAQADLIGNGTNTVSALFYIRASAVPVVTSSTAPFTNPAPSEIEGPPSTIPASFAEGPISGSTISVGGTQITITNQLTAPFCSATLPCSDVFTGFGFVFSAGVDITGVTVDPASSPAFRPIAGGLTFGARDIFVNVVGDDPAYR